MKSRTCIAILALAGLVCAAIKATGDDCQEWCNEGQCWYMDGNCWYFPEWTAMFDDSPFLDIFSMTGGGNYQEGESLLGDVKETCVRECDDRPYSRAQEGQGYLQSTCSGMVLSTINHGKDECLEQGGGTGTP